MMDKYEARDRLLAGEDIAIQTNMGSCRCGDTNGMLYIQDGVLYAKARGSYPWQVFDGPAAECNVKYGFGRTCQEIALLVNEGIDKKVPYSFSSGTRICRPYPDN